MIDEGEVRAFYPEALRYCGGFTGNPEDAQDLLQEALFRCLRAEQTREIQNFRHYLVRAIKHTWVSRWRHIRGIQDISLEMLRENERDAPGWMGVECREIEDFALIVTLRRYIAELPVDMRIAIERVYCDQDDPAVVAQEIGIPINTLKARLRRGRIYLARRWEGVEHAI